MEFLFRRIFQRRKGRVETEILVAILYFLGLSIRRTKEFLFSFKGIIYEK